MATGGREVSGVDFSTVYECVAKLSDLLGRPGDTGQHRIRTLLAIEEWAIDQFGVRVGDRVETRGVAGRLHSGHGWWGFRDDLADGARGTVRAVGFNAYYRYWYCDVEFDSHPSTIFSINVELLVAEEAE
jgi:hypothetical protein